MESLQECYEVEEFLKSAYNELGYDLIEVPPAPIDERVAFILARL
jgi:predicted ATPase